MLQNQLHGKRLVVRAERAVAVESGLDHVLALIAVGTKRQRHDPVLGTLSNRSKRNLRTPFDLNGPSSGRENRKEHKLQEPLFGWLPAASMRTQDMEHSGMLAADDAMDALLQNR